MKHVDNALRKTLFILLGLISLFWLFWTFKYLFTDNLRSTRYIFLFVTILLVLLIFFLNKKFKDLLFKTFKFIYGHKYWFIGILFIMCNLPFTKYNLPCGVTAQPNCKSKIVK